MARNARVSRPAASRCSRERDPLGMHRDRRYATCGGTTTTGHGEIARTSCATLPSSTDLTAPRPRVPTTGKAAPSTAATSARALGAAPHSTRDHTSLERQVRCASASRCRTGRRTEPRVRRAYRARVQGRRRAAVPARRRRARPSAHPRNHRHHTRRRPTIHARLSRCPYPSVAMRAGGPRPIAACAIRARRGAHGGSAAVSARRLGCVDV